MIRASKHLRLATSAPAALLLTVLSIAAAPAAHAAQGDFVNCAGTTSATYHPGIRFEPRQVYASGYDIYSPCISSDPTLKSGFIAFNGTLELSCLQPFVTGSGQPVIHWNNGQHSTLLINGVVTVVGGQIVDNFAGTVTAGEFAGATVTGQITEAQPNAAQCLSPEGVTSAAGTATLQILTP